MPPGYGFKSCLVVQRPGWPGDGLIKHLAGTTATLRPTRTTVEQRYDARTAATRLRVTTGRTAGLVYGSAVTVIAGTALVMERGQELTLDS